MEITPTKSYRDENRLARVPKITGFHLSRRKLIKGMLAMGAVSFLPMGFSCVNGSKQFAKPLLDTHQRDIMHAVQQILFPDDGFGPGANEIHAFEYLLWVLSDPRLDEDDRAYIYDGLRWIEETAQEEKMPPFLKMDTEQQSALIYKISRLDWGESWLSTIMSYILEALLADPQYGGNPDGKGWKWLSHYPGYPRPTKALLYGNILDTLQKQYRMKQKRE